MKKVKFLSFASIIALATCMTACSSDNDEPGTNPEPVNPTETYTWSTDGGLKACDHLLFNVVDNSEDVNGT